MATERNLRDAAEAQALKLQAEITQLSGKLAENKSHNQQALAAAQQKLNDAAEALTNTRREADSLREENGMLCYLAKHANFVLQTIKSYLK